LRGMKGKMSTHLRSNRTTISAKSESKTETARAAQN
jgi:hypothetical protein